MFDLAIKASEHALAHIFSLQHKALILLLSSLEAPSLNILSLCDCYWKCSPLRTAGKYFSITTLKRSLEDIQSGEYTNIWIFASFEMEIFLVV